MGEDGGRDVARVADFGLARDLGTSLPELLDDANGIHPGSVAGDGTLTRTGALAGTPRYMAPEQFRGGRVGPEADQFAFFVALFEALHGHRPFAGDTIGELRGAVEAGRPRPSTRRLPAWLERLIHRGLRPAPEERWPDMVTVARRLREGPRRQRTRRLGALGLLVVLGGGLGIGALASTPIDPCARAAEARDHTWSSERRQALGEHLRAALAEVEERDAADRVLGALDAHFDRWAEARTGTCEDLEARRVTETATGLRNDCLDRVLAVGEGFVEGLEREASSPEDVARALERVGQLPGPERCEDPDVLARVVPLEAQGDERRALEALRTELDAMEGQMLARSEPPPPQEADGLRDRARALGWTPLVAQAELIVAEGHAARGTYDLAIEAAEASLAAAIEASDAARSARAALALAWYEGEGRRDVELAERWLGIADAHVHAAGDPVREQVTSLEHRAVFAQRRGELDIALTHLEQAIALRSEVPELSLAVWRPRNEMAAVHYAAGRLREAADLFEQTANDIAEALGDEHPLRARPLSNYGMTLQRLGEDEAARDALQRALELKRKTLGEQHISVASTLNNLAPLEKSPAERIARYREAIAIVEAQLGPNHPRLGNPTYNLAREQLAIGEPEAALGGWKRFTEIRRAQHGDEHADVIIGEVAQSEALRALDRPEEALTISARWVARLDAPDPPALEVLDRAEVLFQHARNQVAAGDERAAVETARSVVEVCRDSQAPKCVPPDIQALAAPEPPR